MKFKNIIKLNIHDKYVMVYSSTESEKLKLTDNLRFKIDNAIFNNLISLDIINFIK